ncbi:putative nuclear import protein mog1 [Cryptosporidium serpentis]
MEFIQRPLYGDSIRVEIPKNFIDISKIRDVPDHQEVFVDDLSESSIIFEILQQIDLKSDKIGEYYFKDLADCNESTSNEVLYSEPLVQYNKEFLTSACFGIQQVQKRYQEAERNEILYLYVLVIRILTKKTDMLISFNSVMKQNQKIVQENAIYYSNDTIQEIIKHILETFTIRNWDLFI